MGKDTRRIVEYLGSLIEYRDLAEEGHCYHVRKFTEIILKQVMQYFSEYNLRKEDWAYISFAAMLHDVGKIQISDKILLKPGRLTESEFEIVKTHTYKGKKIFEQMKQITEKNSDDYKLFTYCAEVCMYHHEHYDGSGYPEGLKGEEIPISAQVVGLADVYDTMLCERIHKAAYSKERAFEMVMAGECGMFSPKLLELFQMLRQELEEAAE